MFTKMIRARALALAITVAASGFVLVTPTFADDDNSCTQVCSQTFTDAQKLPEPNADSIQKYLNQLNTDINQCIQCASDSIFGGN